MRGEDVGWLAEIEENLRAAQTQLKIARDGAAR